MSDLDKLIEAVERGDEISVICFARGIASNERDAGKEWPHYEVSKAFRGDLNAAAALHEALLPWWGIDGLVHWPDGIWTIRLLETHVEGDDGERWHTFDDTRVKAHAENGARAWLLAILKALRAKESTDDR